MLQPPIIVLPHHRFFMFQPKSLLERIGNHHKMNRDSLFIYCLIRFKTQKDMHHDWMTCPNQSE